MSKPSRSEIDAILAGPVAWRQPRGPRGGWIATEEKTQYSAEKLYSEATVSALCTALLESMDRVEELEGAQAKGAVETYCVGLLCEEAGEVLQHIGKALRFGIDTPGKLNSYGEVSGETPRTLLPSEIGDMLAAIEFTMLHGVVDHEAVKKARDWKLGKLLNPNAKDNLGRPLAPQPARKSLGGSNGSAESHYS